ncbi:MHD domain-containing protein [Mycena indigotica]|uniref:MHD domain-containing protein n=1 Tax=Mycena indigotica TaxID=2126181 RepID=A0A8H6SM75_9AGAR|nr:MHD domain-containing protein [Mycena indigotica]KAF7301598.1 MHD domain-containing protein [Mycena indigotica]
MAIDGLIILDNSGRAIIQSGFRSKPLAYPLLHIDAFNTAVAKSRRAGDIEPVIYVPAYNVAESPSACCHVECADIRILCPVSDDGDPLFAFSFIRTFVDILYEYFGTPSAATLKDNFDVVYQLLEETLDSSGQPLTTSPNALRDIVLPPSLLSKLLSVAGANLTSAINAGSSIGGPFSSPIPWRKAGLRYTSNEIYFDMVEDLKAIVNKHGTTLSSSVWGRMETNCKLSGTPDCLLSFTNPHVITDCAFHPCVRLQRWKRDSSLSFVPPDGHFTLAEYRFTPSASATTARFTNPNAPTVSSRENIPLPFLVKANVEFAESSVSFEFKLTSRMPSHTLDNVVVEMFLGDGATGVKGSTSRGDGGNAGLRGSDGSNSVTGSWTFDSRKTAVRWEISQALPSSVWLLRGSYSCLNGVPRPAHALQIRFDIASYTFSALKVDQLKVTGENYKPYKGVRGRSSGSIEWRW